MRLCDWPVQWQKLIDSGTVPDPAATDLTTQLALLPTVTALLREFHQRADAQAQRRRQLNTLWRVAQTYWREWLAARIDRLRSHVPPDDLVALGEQQQQSAAPAFCGLPDENIHSLCHAWLHGMEEQEKAAVMRRLVDFVHSTGKQPPTAPSLSSPQTPLQALLIDVCAHVGRMVADRAYNGELWPVVESKLRVHIGRRCFARLRTEHEKGATNALPEGVVGPPPGADGGDADESAPLRLGGTRVVPSPSRN